MSDARTDATPWILTGLITLLAFVFTLALPRLLPGTFEGVPTLDLSLGYACWLELLFGLYAGFLFSPRLRRQVSAALIPGWGTLIFLYAVAGLATMVVLDQRPSFHRALLALESLAFLAVAALLFLVGRSRIPEEEAQVEDRQQAQAFLLKTREIRDAFLALPAPLASAPGERLSAQLKRLEERGRQITPLGRPGAEAVDAPVMEALEALAQAVEALAPLSGSDCERALAPLVDQAGRLLQGLDRREAALRR